MSDISQQDTGMIDAESFVQALRSEGVTAEQILFPLIDRVARMNLVAYLKRSCPDLPAAQLQETITNLAGPRYSVLKQIGTVELKPREKFNAKNCFRATKLLGEVKIGTLSEDFQTNFLDTTEEAVTEPQTLVVSELIAVLTTEQLRERLGSENEEITLGEFWELLKRQGRGQPGVLAVNQNATYARIRDTKGKLWNVRARWLRRTGWRVSADVAKASDQWFAHYYVISRAPLAE